MATQKENKILIFDNYDSFTYNLVHLVEQITSEKVDVVRNDQFDFSTLSVYDKIILSPGPGIPEEAGDLLKLINETKATHSLLGVCLGHQAIGEVFGAKLENLKTVFHGVATPITIIEKVKIFKNINSPMQVGRYHSWVVDKNSLPKELKITAVDEFGLIMAMQHTKYDITAVQFHPESILTPQGEILIRNWLES